MSVAKRNDRHRVILKVHHVDLEQLDKFSFDEVLTSTMALAGIATPIIGLVTVAFVLQSWIGPARAGFRLARVGGRLARELSAFQPIRGVVSILVTILIPIAQLLTLRMCYVGGNYLSIQFDENRQLELQALFNQRPHLEFDSSDPFRFLGVDWAFETWTVIKGTLQLDYISGGYVLLAMILIGISYKYAHDGRNRHGMNNVGTLLALPATIVLVIGGVSMILTLILFGLTFLLRFLAGDPVNFVREIIGLLPWFYALVGAGIYFLACQAAVRGSLLVVRSWSAPPAD